MTQYFDFRNGINEEQLHICSKIIQDGGTVIFPTETVYGIGANALDSEAVKKIYIAKGREQDNPLIAHVNNQSMLKQLTQDINPTEQKLIDTFMPGPLTLILKKRSIIPDNVTAGLETVAIRMPSNPIANKLIEVSNVPIAAPSANISGKPSGTNIEDIRQELTDRVDAIIDAGNTDIGLESTVVKVVDNVPIILRPGKITAEDIMQKIGTVKIDSKVLAKVNKNEKVESPGMKYRHYAPSTECILAYNENEQIQIDKINKELLKHKEVCILGFNEHQNKINCKKYISLGSKTRLDEISKNIFTALRQADKLGVDVIIVEGVSSEGLGLAIMNRLLRACEYKMI